MSTPEDIYEDGRREDMEDRMEARVLERRRREPPIGEMCEDCEGAGHLSTSQGCYPHGMYYLETECPRCHGTGYL